MADILQQLDLERCRRAELEEQVKQFQRKENLLEEVEANASLELKGLLEGLDVPSPDTQSLRQKEEIDQKNVLISEWWGNLGFVVASIFLRNFLRSFGKIYLVS